MRYLKSIFLVVACLGLLAPVTMAQLPEVPVKAYDGAAPSDGDACSWAEPRMYAGRMFYCNAGSVKETLAQLDSAGGIISTCVKEDSECFWFPTLESADGACSTVPWMGFVTGTGWRACDGASTISNPLTGGGDSISIGGVATINPDFISTGGAQVTFTDSGAAAYEVSANITDNTILEIDLNAIDTPNDNECLVYNLAGTNFSWETCGSASTGEFSVTWQQPQTTDDIYIKAASALTLTNLDCVAIGGTTPSGLDIEVFECDSNADNCAANTTGAAVTLAAVTTNYNDATLTNASIDDDDWIQIGVVAVTTTADYVHCRVEYSQ